MNRGRALGASLTLVALFAVSCSEPERQVVDSFFAAIEARNENAQKAVSIVPFPGKVRSWEIVEIGEETVEPFALPELQEKVEELSEERRKVKERNDAFVEEHKSAFEKYEAKTKEDPDYAFEGEMADFQQEWEKLRGEQEKLDHTEIDLMKQVEHLRTAAGLSVNYKVKEGFQGEVRKKIVKVKVGDGSADKTYALTLQKFSLVNEKKNINPIGRWVITEIQEVDGPGAQ